MIVGLVGLIGSGKDTAADFLVEQYNFRRESFAGHLKDIVSIVFGWDRDMLEGRTTESRQWREQTDLWWSARLQMNITPRWVLQYWGTDVLRNNFHNDIWLASLEKKISSDNGNIVITDCRFPNEIAILKKLNAKTIIYYSTAIASDKEIENVHRYQSRPFILIRDFGGQNWIRILRGRLEKQEKARVWQIYR